MLFLCYPKCTTCQKAKKWLDQNNISYTLRDIKTENPSAEELEQWLEKSGEDVKKFFNTSGLIYKNMGLKDKLSQMSEKEKIQLLATDGMLVKRPMIISENFVLIGFKQQLWESAITQDDEQL